MPKAYESLGYTHNRFDAISCCDLAFWHTNGDPFAGEYFNRCSALVGEGKTVTRVFLVSRDEFEQGEDLLYHVLIRHFRAGIGFAMIPYDELPPRFRKLGLDFGLWDLGAAYSHFRQHGDWDRTLYIEFSIVNACDEMTAFTRVADRDHSGPVLHLQSWVGEVDGLWSDLKNPPAVQRPQLSKWFLQGPAIAPDMWASRKVGCSARRPRRRACSGLLRQCTPVSVPVA